MIFLRLVAVDETWVHYYEPENKSQSRQWVGPGSLRPKMFKTRPSAGKVMATVFWEAKGVIMLDILLKGRTITGVYYANLLDHVRTAIREKRRGILSKGVLLQQDNAKGLLSHSRHYKAEANVKRYQHISWIKGKTKSLPCHFPISVCESWSLTAELEKRMKACEMRWYRRLIESVESMMELRPRQGNLRLVFRLFSLVLGLPSIRLK